MAASGTRPGGQGPDTIFAVASGFGRSAICVIRLSGPDSLATLATLTGRPAPPARALTLRTLRGPDTGEPLDQAMVVWLPGPGTFTGEDQAELHIHGGLAVRASVLRALAARPQLRAAEPGEFTRRAFLNGKLDLTAVEGLADLIDAETEAQRRQALRQLEGTLGHQVRRWRERLIGVSALCEAGLDFSDEDDVPTDVDGPVPTEIRHLRDEIATALSSGERGERVRDGLTVVIAGAPNAGKSTLLNAIAGRDVAIVSPVAGTTRDMIEVRCDLGGLPVVFVDTAGLRDSDEAIEREGVSRALQRMQDAELVLWLQPLGEAPTQPHLPPSGGWRRVWTKSDLGQRGALQDGSSLVSAASGDGVPELLEAIRAEAELRMTGDGDALLTRERHRVLLADAQECLARALVAEHTGHPELVAEDVRLALRALGRVSGHVSPDDVLDRIFSSFCIGK